MYLTIQNAEIYLGKTLYAYKPLYHHYPLVVKQFNDGRYYYKDLTGTCIPVPDKADLFNKVYFDYALEAETV